MDLFSAIVTLCLVMDPLGNIPLFLAALKNVAPERRRAVLLREIAFAYFVMLAFLAAGDPLLRALQLDQETISVSGGIVLFLIAIRMIFPGERVTPADSIAGEPFVVPLAVPLFAGPSVLATLLLMQRSATIDARSLFIALTAAWAFSGLILLASGLFYRVLRERGLIATERLMGMVLVMVAIQMLMNGVKTFLGR